jgi:hypothetical protein
VQHAVTDHVGGQHRPGLLDLYDGVMAGLQTPGALQPAKSFYHPSQFAQAGALGDSSPWGMGINFQSRQGTVLIRERSAVTNAKTPRPRHLTRKSAKDKSAESTQRGKDSHIT